jgi:hypothetical protein
MCLKLVKIINELYYLEQFNKLNILKSAEKQRMARIQKISHQNMFNQSCKKKEVFFI